MVVSYIQSQKENFTKNEPYLCGKIFYGFLRHYGIMFDFNKYLINNKNSMNHNNKKMFSTIGLSNNLSVKNVKNYLENMYMRIFLRL